MRDGLDGFVKLLLLALAVSAAGAGCGSGSDGMSEPDGSVRDSGDEAHRKDAAADGLRSNCPVESTKAVPAGAAASAGFTGTSDAYFALYNVTCGTAADCAGACTKAGGTEDSCTKGSACPTDEDGPNMCLPPTYWLSVDGALSESDMTTSAAELILVDDGYDDALRLTSFGVSIPDDASITGIQFKVRRNADGGFAADDSVLVLKDGAPVGEQHRASGAWPLDLAYQTYGGAYDAWGESWTVADVRAKGFGLAIAPRYTGPAAGNDRAHIDSVRVTVFYVTPCE